MAQREPGRNDPCRCGSGLKYKRCCLGKEVAFVNYKGESAVYLRNELNVFANRLTALLEEIISGRDALAKLTGFKLLQDIYNIYGQMHNFFSRFYSCGKGCAHCCCLYITVSRLEADFVKHYVTSSLSEDVQKELYSNYLERKKRYPANDHEHKGQEALLSLATEYFNKKIPCIFLSGNGECLVYEARPFSCRGLVATSDPENCKGSNRIKCFYPYAEQDSIKKAILTLSRRVYGDHAAVRHFPAWFSGGFGNNS